MKERYAPWYYYENWQNEPIIHISLPLAVSYGDGMITKDFIDTEEFRTWLEYTYTMLGRAIDR